MKKPQTPNHDEYGPVIAFTNAKTPKTLDLGTKDRIKANHALLTPYYASSHRKARRRHRLLKHEIALPAEPVSPITRKVRVLRARPRLLDDSRLAVNLLSA